MTITLDLQPETERGLVAQATARGLSLLDYVNEIVVRQAHTHSRSENRTGQELIDSCEKVRGLLTDDEVDILFRRTPSFARLVEFE